MGAFQELANIKWGQESFRTMKIWTYPVPVKNDYKPPKNRENFIAKIDAVEQDTEKNRRRQDIVKIRFAHALYIAKFMLIYKFEWKPDIQLGRIKAAINSISFNSLDHS